MNISLWRWRLHRALLDRFAYRQPFSGTPGHKHALFISERDPICHAQLFPFFQNAEEMKRRWSIEVRELPLASFSKGQNPFRSTEVDAVLFQTWFDLLPPSLEELVNTIHATWPNAKLAYLDWFAPTDLRYANVLDTHVSAYIKKQLLRNEDEYERPTLGDTNLTDYYCRRFSIDLPSLHHRVPRGFFDKVTLSPNFEYSAQIMKILPKRWMERPRDIDLHARLAVSGTAWYSKMRIEAARAAEKLAAVMVVANSGIVSKRIYLSEIASSKMCFSPFGYGEVCWRDYEAMCLGALLLKPDMSHLYLRNNPFKPYETYVPLAWDLSDLEEKALYYKNNKRERIRIAQNAFAELKKNLEPELFLSDAELLWKRLGVL